jgi:hypothetical protein
MPDARWNDPREYGDLDRGGERATIGTETITTRVTL